MSSSGGRGSCRREYEHSARLTSQSRRFVLDLEVDRFGHALCPPPSFLESGGEHTLTHLLRLARGGELCVSVLASISPDLMQEGRCKKGACSVPYCTTEENPLGPSSSQHLGLVFVPEDLGSCPTSTSWGRATSSAPIPLPSGTRRHKSWSVECGSQDEVAWNRVRRPTRIDLLLCCWWDLAVTQIQGVGTLYRAK